VEIHGAERAGISDQLVRQDLERALRDGLRGFQQLEVGARQPTPSGGTVFVPLAGLRRLNRPVLQKVARTDDVRPGQMRGVSADGQAILIANVDGQFFAVQDRCGESPLPLRFGTLDENVVTCSWHGCRYDVRTGHRLDRPGIGLTACPVRVSDGDIEVAVAVTPVGEPT
jgi:nitrite reductase/ring-hydroxylating ferredoxin subunit